MDPREAAVFCDQIRESIRAAVVCTPEFIDLLLVGVLGRGHILIEDAPGTGKTLTARSLADAVGLTFSRIQFTPDLLPSDVTGTHVFDERDRSFEFRPGPIFANVVLADELNRAPPKTQSALLEAMEERQVTVGGETHELPDPFVVIATQNPIEQEGTFPLPEAQLDRFLVKAEVGYPGRNEEVELLKRRAQRSTRSPTVTTVIDAEIVREMRDVPESIQVHEDVMDYIVAIVRGTRSDDRVAVGISPRGTQRLFEGARVVALLDGRGFVIPDDVKNCVPAIATHRLVLTDEAMISGASKSDILQEVVESVSVPTVELDS